MGRTREDQGGTDEAPGTPGPAPGHAHHAAGHAHGHGHAHGPPSPASARLRRLVAAVLIPFAAAVVVGLVVLWPGGTPAHPRTGVGFDQETRNGRVTKVEELPCAQADAEIFAGPTGAPAAGGPPDTSGPSGTNRSSGTAPPVADGQPGDDIPPGSNGAAAHPDEPGGVPWPPPSLGAPGAPGTPRAAPADCHRATIEVTSGADKGRRVTELVRPSEVRRFSVGQEVVLAYSPGAPEDLRYSVIDVRRGPPMLLLAGLFAVAVIVVGRLRGLTALIALAISFAVLSFFILPAILHGSDPLLVAVVGGSAIMFVALYLCHGLSTRTSVAVVGTLVSLSLIGVLGSLFIGWAHLTGNTSDETGLVHVLYPDIELHGLLLAGFIIGSLGVLDDVTVTQTSAVWELKQADPTMTARRLYQAGIRIGRDHIASTVNTLVLAYAGAALPLMLLFSIARRDVLDVATSEIVAEEIARTLVGSIGLVASVPVTTGLAAILAAADHGKPARGEPAKGGPAPVPVPAARGRHRGR
ncbi:YibE/F family protein [Embleya scabrispora]|uniref:YibE/F family protein n=1 Tax=Embleya scabrispora TaxID=159449 RepID=UPI000380ED25|nr:YibE/F family protein [Embleya scabrispora]MYS78903.1 YibE/F family protein [Streptomyces sp. SID5474]